MKKPRLKLINIRKNDPRKLKQREVAAVIGVTASYYGMIELGDRTPDLELAKKIADFWGVSIEELFFNDLINKTLCDYSVPSDLPPTGTD